MAATPFLKIYTPQGVYVARCSEFEAAAALASFYGPGCTVRDGHAKKNTLWTEGYKHGEFKHSPTRGDGFAGESYDHAANVMVNRMAQQA